MDLKENEHIVDHQHMEQNYLILQIKQVKLHLHHQLILKIVNIYNIKILYINSKNKNKKIFFILLSIECLL